MVRPAIWSLAHWSLGTSPFPEQPGVQVILGLWIVPQDSYSPGTCVSLHQKLDVSLSFLDASTAVSWCCPWATCQPWSPKGSGNYWSPGSQTPKLLIPLCIGPSFFPNSPGIACPKLTCQLETGHTGCYWLVAQPDTYLIHIWFSGYTSGAEDMSASRLAAAQHCRGHSPCPALQPGRGSKVVVDIRPAHVM